MATTFTNQATLSYNGSSVLSNIAVGLIEDVLSVSKEALTEQYSAGDRVTYVISIVNNSDTAAEDLTVTDNLGAYESETGILRPLTYEDGSLQYYRNGRLQPDPTAAADDDLVISGISVPADGSVILVYAATVNEFAPLEAQSVIGNTVTVSGEDVNAVTDRETISVTNEAVLSVVKSITPIPVAENGELTYTFQLLNSGNTALTAEDNAVITDTFSPILRNIIVTLDSETLTLGTDYTYDEATSEFSTAEGLITVPAATYDMDPETGAQTVTPGSATMTVTGTVSFAVQEQTFPPRRP